MGGKKDEKREREEKRGRGREVERKSERESKGKRKRQNKQRQKDDAKNGKLTVRPSPTTRRPGRCQPPLERWHLQCSAIHNATQRKTAQRNTTQHNNTAGQSVDHKQ